MLVWKEEYAIGVEMIDAQHKHLFEIGNSAYKLLRDEFCTDKYDKIVEIIEDLRQYTMFHFKSEEEYMKKINYRKYFSQKVEHDDFIRKVNAIDFDNVDENPEKYLEDILAFIFNWTLEHILQKDKLIKAE
ncbi:MAG: bacteriohemerythrin [Anaerosolibacter sp.]|jgi:hemerythrin|uniref:bacteriohemerythrin n=1 Tax=Anaerosolibacter sp. TaxID=1872527 RepID=UPI002609B458|nr:hemerythrin family protein [Anaerosolibacter sp.]MDF2545980.1 bacteriohemerythrin [Anaerosolibacter sp.]